jgi:hypothetical protein
VSLPLSPVLDEAACPEPLPETLQTAVDESVLQFESKFGLLRSWAQSQGWIEEYRSEVTRLVRLTLEQK